VSSIQTNLPSILAALRAAAGPNVPIVGMTLYNPFLAAWLLGPKAMPSPSSVRHRLIGPVNALLRATFEAPGASVADVEGAFSSKDFDTLVDLQGVGTVPINVAKICMWTYGSARRLPWDLTTMPRPRATR
jgi:hypothetical protein